MKRLNPPLPRRACRMSAAVARTPKEAALHLVRLEFEAARLDLSLRQTARQTARDTALLQQTAAQRRRLLALLSR